MKKYLPHFIAVIIFAAITMIYFAPLFEGKQLKQSDVLHYQGMSKEIQDHRKQYGEEPLWTNSMFSGMPAYQISVLYPNNLIGHLNMFFKKILPPPSTIIFISLIGFYFLLVSLRVSPVLSMAGAIAFSLSSYYPVLISAGHNPKGYAMAYMAPVVAGILLTYRGKLLLGASITALALALEIDSNHLQITYYLFLLVIFIVAGEFVRLFRAGQLPYFAKASGLLVIAAILAVLPNLTNLVLTNEYGKDSTRGRSDLTMDAQNKTSGLDKDYATQWSYGIDETWTLLVPNFKGGASGRLAENENALKGLDNQYAQYIGNMNSYFGDQPFTSGPVYVGAIICFLFVLGMFIVKDSLKWWLFGATVLSIMLAWGKNFMPLTDLFMDLVPGYNKFRAVSMTLVIAQFTMPLLAILTVKEIVEEPEILKVKRKQLYLSLGFTAGLCLLFAIAPDPFNTFFSAGEQADVSKQLVDAGLPQNDVPVFLSGIEEARKNVFQADAKRSFFFILLAFAMIFFYSIKRYNKTILFSGLAFLVLVDLWAVDKRYLNSQNYEPKKKVQGYEPTEADLQILQDKDPSYRVFNLTTSPFQDASTSFFHKSIGGYHGAKLKRYQELIEYQISKNNMQVLNMLNTRYLITPGPDQRPVVQRNPDALGNAWFVKDLRFVANADSELTALSKFDASETAIVDKIWQDQLQGFKPVYDSTASIKLDSYKANELVYTSQSSTDQVAVFSEIFFDKGWQAYVDGQPVPHFRANFVLRAMKVPAGKHKIEFRFEPAFYETGQSIALIASIILIVSVIAGIVWEYRKKPAERANG